MKTPRYIFAEPVRPHTPKYLRPSQWIAAAIVLTVALAAAAVDKVL